MEQDAFSERRVSRASAKSVRRVLGWAGILLALALIASAALPLTAGAAREGDHDVAGGGKTIIEGGTGAPAYIPVTTVLAFHARGQTGHFECLALAPTSGSGAPESGTFEVNAMYVTGSITSVTVNDGTAVLRGTAVVTGLGAGPAQSFTFTVNAGGPGTAATLEVSGLTFHEILLQGQVTIH